MSGREVNLDGTETSIIKAIGIGGGEISGATLMERCPELAEAELIDTLKGLMSLGYVDADRNSFYKKEELESNVFRVNSGYSKELKDALNPRPEKAKSKRVRRE
jgi:hypothetical protein